MAALLGRRAHRVEQVRAGRSPASRTETWMPVPASSAASVSLSEITAALVAL